MRIHIRNLICNFCSTLAAVLLATAALAAPPQKVTVIEANPNSAVQGETLDVVISGSGFGPGSTVRYLVSGTRDDTQIDVNNVVYNEADGSLVTTIQVRGEASVTDYDIEVRVLSGRKGKGTTLFHVESSNAGGQNNLPTISCDELFNLPSGTCTAEGTSEPCVFEQTLDERGWGMLQHCDTHEMLIMPPDWDFYRGRGFRLNLVSPWRGGFAGLVNVKGSSRIDDFIVMVSNPLLANGCDPATPIQAAIHFDPDLEPVSGDNDPRSAVDRNVIETSGGARFCHAIQMVGSDPRKRHPYKQTSVNGNWIKADSYERAAIWGANINQTDIEPGNPETAIFSNNVIEATTVPCAVGILVENVERPEIDDNVIHATNGAGCTDRTVGIVIADSGRNKASPLGPDYDFESAEPANLVGNTVITGSNGSIAIVIDSQSDTEMSNSTITAGWGADVGVCVETGATFTEKGKRSRFDGFDPGNDIVFTADCGAGAP